MLSEVIRTHVRKEIVDHFHFGSLKKSREKMADEKMYAEPEMIFFHSPKEERSNFLESIFGREEIVMQCNPLIVHISLKYKFATYFGKDVHCACVKSISRHRGSCLEIRR